MKVQSWRAFTEKERIDYFEGLGKAEFARPRSILAFRQQLSPVDTYCYLKARFGAPNGYQTIVRRDDSDNWIHWDFLLKADDATVYICGTYREIHFHLSEELSDEEWPELIRNIKADFARAGKEKGEVLKSLEKWVIFQNKYVEIANVCAELYDELCDKTHRTEELLSYRFSSSPSMQQIEKRARALNKISKRSSALYRACLELSLLTPVLAEAFINMAILILCRPEVRQNERQLEAFIRSQIDNKIFDLPYKCQGFKKPIDPNAAEYKNFKRVMDKRNTAIHGNVDPQKEQIETVYFESKRPLFKQSGDHIGRHFEALARQYDIEGVMKDYEDTHAFLIKIARSLDPPLQAGFWRVMEDRFPGYDLNRKITGVLLPEVTATAYVEGIRFDDELPVNW